jgi:DNA gyrase subunit A
MDNGKKRIIVTEIPYQVNKTTMIEKIADLVKNKIIEGISDLRDESNREGIRVVIELKKDAIPEVLLNQLYKMSQLQVNYSINMLSLVHGEPKILGIKAILNEYIKHQEEVIRRRTQFDLKNALDRQHVLFGLSIAGQNIDEVINNTSLSLFEKNEISKSMNKEIDITPKSFFRRKK